MKLISASGRDPERVRLDSVREGAVSMADFTIHPDTLERQAQIAEAHANPELGANFRRAAELTAFSDQQILDLYAALRPYRSTGAELEDRARDLEGRGAVACAALFREAAQVYARRGLLRQ